MKTYVYRQTTIQSQILSTEQKNQINFSLAIISIKHHVLSRDANGD